MDSSDTRRPTIPLERMETAEILSCVEPFVAARPPEIDQLARASTRIRKPSGTALLSEGQPSDGLYVVLRGRVNLVRVADGGRDLILSALGPGDIFGEVAAFGGGPKRSSISAAMSTTSCSSIAEPKRL